MKRQLFNLLAAVLATMLVGCAPVQPSNLDKALESVLNQQKAEFDRGFAQGQQQVQHMAFQCLCYRNRTGNWPTHLIDLDASPLTPDENDLAERCGWGSFNPDDYKDAEFAVLPDGRLRVKWRSCLKGMSSSTAIQTTLAPGDKLPATCPAPEKAADMDAKH